MIISKTPFRISFFGGGTDFPQWFEENGGAVLSCSIDKYCYISLRKLPPFFSHKHRIVYSDIELCESTNEIKHPSVKACLKFLNVSDGMEIHYDGDLPSRSGLGSSSSFTVGLINALKAHQGQMVSHQKLADLAIHIERNVIGEAGGLQDQIAAAFGGLNHVEFSRNGYYLTPVILGQKKKEELENSLCLFFTGKSRIAEEIEKTKLKQISDRKSFYQEIQGLTKRGLDVLQAPTFSAKNFGELLHEGWKLKKSLARDVTNTQLDEIYDQAILNGAIGGKLLGAGGGGFFLFCVENYQKARLIESMPNLLHVPFRIEYSGAQIALYQPS